MGLPSFGVVSGDILDNSANEIKNRVYTKAIIKVRSAGCWVSSYSDYQQFLSDKIISCRDSGWTFKRIADWFNANGFQTPRNKTFSDRHVHGILKKRLARDERFFAEPTVTIIDTDLLYEVQSPLKE
ncbi:MAG: recombinase family protein [Gammaproteobacteria bacterium]|nr:recombinase family protein [Gammaproteobacteria bacterium]